MDNFLLAIAKRFWPELKSMNQQRQIVGAGEALTFLFSAPMAVVGIIWLVAVTDPKVIQQSWWGLLLLGLLMFLFRKLGFFFIAEIRAGRYASSDGSMESMVLWIGLFLFGPTALWLAVFWSSVDFAWNWHKLLNSTDRWSRARNYSFYLTTSILASLVAFNLYMNLGGEVPPTGLGPEFILLAFAAITAHFFLGMLLWAVYIAYAIWAQIVLTQSRSIRPIARFLIVALVLPYLAQPFAMLAAGLYIQNGLTAFIFMIIGLLLVAALTRQLSWVAESNRLRSRQLERLEALGRGIINAPPDASTLPELLQEHVQNMFPPGHIAIWISPDQVLLKNPDDWSFDIGRVWSWLSIQEELKGFTAKDKLPWGENNSLHPATILAPILDVASDTPRGGVYLEVHSLSQPWDEKSLANLYPGMLSVAAQISSALHQADIYGQALAYQRVSQELALAGRIQSSFLPDELPSFSGWQMSVTLLPARETSGDFFDWIRLSNGYLGILIADVADKGVGAALYMALTRTLIRTYAIEFDDDPHPEDVFFAVNGRLLQDARANLFVTAFYGILDPTTGILTYSNAGHNPPLLIKAQGERNIYLLGQTGMPIGVDEDEIWTLETTQIMPGDVLILYTDGIPDAINSEGEFFLDKRLLEVAIEAQKLPASEIQEYILNRVQDFVGQVPQFDDITLMVLVRDA